MAKSKFDPGEPIVMRGTVKFAEDEDGKITVTLSGYDIPITTTSGTSSRASGARAEIERQ